MQAVQRAMGEGHFADCFAPSGIGEPVDKRGAGGYRGDTAPISFDTRAILLRGRHRAMLHNVRSAVLSAARMRRALSVESERASREMPAWTAWRALPYYPRPLDRYAALDEWSTNRDAAWHAIESSMQAMPNRDGRGTGDEGYSPGTVVNAREVRMSPRWTASTRRDIRMRGDDGELHPVDWTCYRVNPDGSRTALVTTATGKRRKRRAASTTSATVERDNIARDKVRAMLATRGADLVADGTLA